MVSVLQCFGFSGGNIIEIFFSMGLPNGPQIISNRQQFTEPSHRLTLAIVMSEWVTSMWGRISPIQMRTTN